MIFVSNYDAYCDLLWLCSVPTIKIILIILFLSTQDKITSHKMDLLFPSKRLIAQNISKLESKILLFHYMINDFVIIKKDYMHKNRLKVYFNWLYYGILNNFNWFIMFKIHFSFFTIKTEFNYSHLILFKLLPIKYGCNFFVIWLYFTDTPIFH